MTPVPTADQAVIDATRYDAVVFDLDGVVTDTASVHSRAWRRLFDEFLTARPAARDEDHSAFTDEDYLRYVDGRSRYDGVRTFLASRGIEVDEATVRGLGDRKDHYFLRSLEEEGTHAFPGTVALIGQLAASGLSYAVISASRNCADVLAAAGLQDVFDVRVDGLAARELGLAGKPDPAVFLVAAHRLGVTPSRTVVVEDALAGVEAGRAGGFGLVIGVDRDDHADELTAHGADLVVADLAEVSVVPEYEPAR
ncbi:HAD superfamily hydrolase (TIGR01509 family)/beta-phosphoglucomutase family hydrolase [Kribbella voronezhensis]|uniref:Beta-phosphoglucomutase n=1 Tax=Kribbella voronezhensis TaxID=2512212 RepID=A0A4R7SYI8_9ACTN|nr:beta-phosphoglucomutase family hydrolase [Kribbella voronezhensis]TDU83796.1 HAD superfamily hydrolase (TIGR01509 family)/beta-phosphoglucomutase family hydrolase [Kribbella voronezhensis]